MTRKEEISKAIEDFLNKEDLTCLDCAAYSFQKGAEWADSNPKNKWIAIEEDLPYKHRELLIKTFPLGGGLTKKVLVLLANDTLSVENMFFNIEEMEWEWSSYIPVLYWAPIIPEFKED